MERQRVGTSMEGHPASSKWTLFEAFAQNIIELEQSNPEQWPETAIFVTVDEGGGFYDSGFIQPVDPNGWFENGSSLEFLAYGCQPTDTRAIQFS